jgi:hypothetical protein
MRSVTPTAAMGSPVGAISAHAFGPASAIVGGGGDTGGASVMGVCGEAGGGPVCGDAGIPAAPVRALHADVIACVQTMTTANHRAISFTSVSDDSRDCWRLEARRRKPPLDVIGYRAGTESITLVARTVRTGPTGSTL